jgi:superfamily II DNA or RNA helicase
MPSAEAKIKAFRNRDRRWIVSVAMISEGIDTRRLRVLVYLPNPLTELAFRQAIGRVVRTAGPLDDTRAYVVMPSFETFGFRHCQVPSWNEKMKSFSDLAINNENISWSCSRY